MSFDTLLKEVESLGEAERQRLLAFMVALHDRERSGDAAKLAEKIDDKSPERWLSPEECARQQRLLEIMGRIRVRNPFRGIKDPVAWQREMREDVKLPGRD